MSKIVETIFVREEDALDAIFPYSYDSSPLEANTTYNVSLSATNHLGIPGTVLNVLQMRPMGCMRPTKVFAARQHCTFNSSSGKILQYK